MREEIFRTHVKKAGCNERGCVAAVVQKDGEEKVLIIDPIVSSMPDYFAKTGKISYTNRVESVVEIWLRSDAPLFWHLDDEEGVFHLYTFYADICYVLRLRKWEVKEIQEKIFEEIYRCLSSEGEHP